MLIEELVKIGVIIYNGIRFLVDYIFNSQSLRLMNEPLTPVHGFTEYGSDASHKSRLPDSRFHKFP
ncbi:hypothetical protein D3C73_1567220 [compost metagenome]